jgi:signal transduction histidine kinase/type II secretory pathway pseudopilin PulG
VRRALARGRRAPAPLLVLLLSLLCTAGVTGFLAHTARQRDEARFRNAVQSTSDRVEARLETYAAMLRSAAALFSTQHEVTREEFSRYVAWLDVRRRYPGVQGIGFSARVPPGERAAFEARVREDAGFEDFRIWPDVPREEQHTILLLEPLDRRNRAAIGYDMSTEATRREAMGRARDSGLPALSGKVTLVQEVEAEKQPGFLLYVPVYRAGAPVDGVQGRRAQLAGFVYAPFRAEDLFAGIFGTETAPRAAFQVYDGPAAGPEHLLHDSRLQLPGHLRAAPGAFRTTEQVQLAGRVWTLTFTSLPSFEMTSGSSLVPLVAVAGLLASLALFAVSLAQARTAQRVQGSLEALQASQAERDRLLVQAQEAVRSRDEFLSVAAHELRTPLTSLKLQHELLVRRLGDGVPPEAVRQLSGAQRQVGRLAQLVESLLDVSRISAGRLLLAPTDVELGSLVGEVLERMHEVLARAGCAVALEVEGRVEGRWDAQRLEQVVVNLLGNAAKYGAGRPVVVRVGRTADGQARLTVRDEGIGMTPEVLARIFERFERGVSERHYGGLGLGLFITRELVDAMGGSVTAESVPGRGSTFTVTLPGDGGAAAPGGEASPPEAPPSHGPLSH